MADNAPTDPRWRKSSRSVANGTCVELAYDAVRDSKNPAPTLRADVRALVAAIKDGRLVTT